MSLITPTTTVSLHGNSYKVEELSKEAQRLIALLDKGREQEAELVQRINEEQAYYIQSQQEANDDLQIVQHGLLHIQSMLIETLANDFNIEVVEENDSTGTENVTE